MGTLGGDTDASMGMTFGIGGTGIWHRAEDCFEAIVSYIRDVSSGRSKIDTLRVDCFGFSRGAATARHLVHLLLHEEKTDSHGGWAVFGLMNRVSQFKEVVTFEIPFVGLFDTVAHYRYNFKDDTKELDLDAIKELDLDAIKDPHLDAIEDTRVKRVVQLAAGDEHRYNFPLTDISSAGTKGLQIFLPGAHSDVGGSYNMEVFEYMLPVFEAWGTSDGLLFARCRHIRRELVELGWYREDQIKIQRDDEHQEEQITIQRDDRDNEDIRHKYSVVATRSISSNKYSYIPLHIMADKAKAAENGLTFNLEDFNYEDEPVLIGIRKLIKNNMGLDDQDWLYNKDAQILTLRHIFLHFSSDYTLVKNAVRPNKPQFFSPGLKKPYEDADPMSGHRKRQIFPG
jgi:hypothetical protein